MLAIPISEKRPLWEWDISVVLIDPKGKNASLAAAKARIPNEIYGMTSGFLPAFIF